MRHHYEPQRRTPSINLGQSGSYRVTSEPDPDFAPPPFLGFTHAVWTRRDTGEVVAVAELGPPHHPADRENRTARQDAEQAMADHEPCADCVRCATCRREWCPTVVDRCPGEESWWMHPTGGPGTRDAEYCYRCTSCPGGYFQFHDPGHPACTEVVQEPHVTADGRGSE